MINGTAQELLLKTCYVANCEWKLSVISVFYCLL